MNTFPAQKKRFVLAREGREIEVVATPVLDSQRPIFIMCHPHPLFDGTMDNKVVTTATRTAEACGLATIRFNYRGVGDSNGRYGEGEGEYQDLCLVMDWVREMLGEVRFWLGGFSFGTYIAYRAAVMADVIGLLTVAPCVETFDFTAESVPDVPWSVILGDADEIVSVPAMFDFLQSVDASLTLYKLPGVGHFFHGKLADLRQRIEQVYNAQIVSQ